MHNQRQQRGSKLAQIVSVAHTPSRFVFLCSLLLLRRCLFSSVWRIHLTLCTIWVVAWIPQRSTRFVASSCALTPPSEKEEAF